MIIVLGGAVVQKENKPTKLKGNPVIESVKADGTWNYQMRFPDSTKVIVESDKALGYQVGDTLTFLTRYI